MPVYFDNFKVAHTRGRIVEENHYYAYGLRISAISSRKLFDANEGELKNQYLYNDKELFEEGDLDWLDYGFRNYDPQIGRFPQLDPLTDDYPFLTPYQYASNDPITNIDIDGLEGVPALGSEASGFLAGGFNTLNETVVKSSARVLKTAKPGLSIANLAINAIKIASNVVSKQLENKSINQGLGNSSVSNDLMSQVIGFAEANQGNMNYTDLAMLTEMTKNYYNGLNLMAWWAKGDFLKLNRAVIQSNNLPAEVKIQLVQFGIQDSQTGFNTMIRASANTALFISSSGLFPNVGGGSRMPFQSQTQLNIVNATRIRAGSLKEFKSLVNQLSQPGSKLTQQELQQFKVLTEKFGGRLRFDLNPIKGKIKEPHVQVEGLGPSVQSRHVWLGNGVN